MRPIKCRAWDGSAWVYFTLNDLATNRELQSLWPQLTHHSEHTGMLDKHGKEIWEGDIVLWGHKEEEKVKVVFDAPSFVLEEMNQQADRIRLYDHRSIEIIGNIYQNPELLK